MSALQFANLERLYWLPVVLAVVVLLPWYASWQRRRSLARLGDPAMLARLAASVSRPRRIIKSVMFGASALLLVFALARPQIIAQRRIEIQGMDVVVAVDASKSMMVADVQPIGTKGEPTRLARARAYALDLIAELPGDRIAPIVFASGTAHFPLTADAEAASSFLTTIGPADLPQGSDLVLAVKAGRCLLRPDLYDQEQCSNVTGRRGNGGSELWKPTSPDNKGKNAKPTDEEIEIETEERGKAIVLITDGGEDVPGVQTQVQLANKLGIAVFVVGMGSDEGGEVYDIDGNGKRTKPKHDKAGNLIISRRDGAALTQMVGAARYFAEVGVGEVSVTPLVEALQASARGKASKVVKRPTDIFTPFVFAAFLLLLIEAVISERRRSLYPEQLRTPERK